MAGVTLGLDLGTSGVKVVALDVGRRVVAQATRTYPLLTPQPGWTEQRPQDWVAATLEALRDVTEQLAASGHVPLALGLSGQMHGAVFLDAHGDAVCPAPLWNDQRTADAVQDIEARIPRAELIARTGNRAVTGFQLPKVLWLRSAQPELFARVRRVLLPKDYLGFVLTGQQHTEPSDASGVGALNLNTRTWDGNILDALGLPASLFPAVIASCDVSGTLLDEVAAPTGLPAGLPVVAGGGDNAAAGIALGLTSTRPSVGSVSLGTSGVIFVPLTQPTPDPQGRVHLVAHADGGYNLLGVTLSAAGALQWFREKLAPGTAFDTLMEEAAQVPPGADGLTFLPYLSGERSPFMNAGLRASFSGLSLAHGRGHLVRALLEGAALALDDAYAVMRPLSAVASLLATGGGARSELWLGMVSGALGLPVRRSQQEPGAAEGAALLAFPAAGFAPDLQTVLQTVQPSGAAVGMTEMAAARRQHRQELTRVGLAAAEDGAAAS